MPNRIWFSDNKLITDWFKAGSKVSHMGWVPTGIPKPGSAEFLNLPEPLKMILRLDNPDLILTLDEHGTDLPVLSMEITTTTPQSQHAKQRVARLVAAAEAGVPSLYIIPQKKLSGGTTYSLGPDLYYGAQKISDINSMPVLIYHYPDSHGRLRHDPTYPNHPDLSSPSISSAFTTIDSIITSMRGGLRATQLRSRATAVKNAHALQSHTAKSATVNVSNYTTLTEIPTSDLYTFLRRETAIHPTRLRKTIERLPTRISKRETSLIFRPAGRLFDHAGDPYTGMLAFFDYAFCRSGNSVEKRTKNLIHMPINEEVSSIVDQFGPEGYHSYWQNDCPFQNPGVPTLDEQFRISHHLQYGCVFTKKKPLRILGYFSDMIVFQDSILVF